MGSYDISQGVFTYFIAFVLHNLLFVVLLFCEYYFNFGSRQTACFMKAQILAYLLLYLFWTYYFYLLFSIISISIAENGLLYESTYFGILPFISFLDILFGYIIK